MPTSFYSAFLKQLSLFVILVVGVTPPAASAERIEVRLSEPEESNRQARNWPVIVGVALPEGALQDAGHARLVNEHGEEVLSQIETACYWGFEKQSVKWLLVDTLVQLDGRNTAPLFLEYGADVSRAALESALTLSEDENTYTVRTGKIEVTVNKKSFRLFDRVCLDADGDGRYREDEELLGADDASGIFWVDHDGRQYYASRDGEMEWEVEKRGPVRITLRGEGWFVDPAGNKVMKQITRMRFHPNCDWVRVYQTFIWTAGEETEIKQITLVSRLSAPPDKAAFGVDGRAVSAARDIRLLQDSYSHCSWKTGGRGAEGTRSDGWVEAWTGRGRVLAIIRDCAEQQPKGFGIEGAHLAIDLYPPHETPLSTKESARLTRRHRKQPEWEKDRQYSFDPKHPYRYMPTGFAKTHEVVYRFLGPSAPADGAVKTNDLVQRPVVAFADPERVCAAKPFGFYIPAKDTRKWPRQEELIDAIYRWGARYDEEMEHYEILNFGDVIWNQGSGRDAALYRYWGNQSKGWVNVPWYLFARSGERYYCVRGEQHARHVMDVDSVSHGAAKGMWIWPRVVAAQWQYCSVHFGWTASLLDFWQQYEYLYSCYYLTGYERAERMARELEKAVLASGYEKAPFYKETTEGTVVPFDPDNEDLGPGERITRFTRTQYNTIRQLTVLAVNSGDEKFLELARRYQKVALLNRTSQGLFRDNYMGLPQSQVYFHLATKDESAAAAIMKHQQGMLLQAYAFGLSGELSFLENAASQLEMLTRAIDLGKDEYNRGAYPGGTQAAGDLFFLGALITLGHFESNPGIPTRDLLGLKIDGGPEGTDTGPKTGKYLRRAYVLEKKDGAFDLDVEIPVSYQENMNVEMRVISPSGKEVAREDMVPRIDNTEKEGIPSGAGPYNVVSTWSLTIPADGETGVYTVRAIGQQKEGSFHNGFTLTVTSSTGKLVWHIPPGTFNIRGEAGGRLWFKPDPASGNLEIRQLYARVPYVLRLYDAVGKEVARTESSGPDTAHDMGILLGPLTVTTQRKPGLWSFQAAAHYLMMLHVRGALPFYSMSREEWFDPTDYGIQLE